MNATILFLQTAKQIAEVMGECANSFFDQSLNNQDDINVLAEKFHRYGRVYAAYLKKKPAGFIAFYCNNAVTHQAYLSMIIVKDNFQHMGIGAELLNEMIKDCVDHMCETVKLEVNKANVPAIEFYRHKGFKRSGAASDKTDFYVLLLP